MTIYGVAGTQASKINANSVVVFKMHNLHPLKRKSNEQDESDDESEGMNWFYAKIRTLFNFLNCTKLEFKNIIMWIMYVITAKMSTNSPFKGGGGDILKNGMVYLDFL